MAAPFGGWGDEYSARRQGAALEKAEASCALVRASRAGSEGSASAAVACLAPGAAGVSERLWALDCAAGCAVYLVFAVGEAVKLAAASFFASFRVKDEYARCLIALIVMAVGAVVLVWMVR